MATRGRKTPARARTAAPAAEPVTRRMEEQRWVIDNTIRAVGIEWDQPRLNSYATACGPLATGDLNGVRARVQKYADINPAFEAVARRREAAARSAESQGHRVSARENYFVASVFWAASQWTLLANDDHNHHNNQRKRDCYLAYAKLADHTVEPAWIPLPGGKRIPGWLHLPYGYRGGKVPAVVSIPGMDGFKEANVALYGDRWLSRGIAVLVIEGPGQYESALLGVPFTMAAWQRAGRAAWAWLAAREEIDATRIGLLGNSFGSFFATVAAGAEPRYRAVAVSAICLEPHGETIFEKASPTFKHRFMYMSGMTDEARFDAFRRTMTWEGHANRIRAPYLCIAGEADELSPLEHTEALLRSLQGPRRYVVYQDSRHSVGGVPSSNLGPFAPVLAADWVAQTLSGKTFPSEKWFVESTGRIVRTPFA